MAINMSSLHEGEEKQIAEEQKEKKSIESIDNEFTWQNKVKDFFISLQGVKLKEKIFFLQNIRVMIRGGLSLGQALDIVSKQIENVYFKKILLDISSKVQAGVTFSKALEAYPKVFNKLFINMIKSGEMSGNMENVLNKLYIQMKRDHELISKVKGAMIYPAVVVVAMFGIGTFVVVFVIPKLITIFNDFQAQLPLATRILIAVSKFITHNGLVTLASLIIFVVVFIKFYKSRLGIKFFHKLFLKLPIISNIVKKINLARFCRTTSSLLKTDISIVQSLQITSMVVGNYYYQRALGEAAKKITKGLQINKVLANYPNLFSPTVLQMLKVGEETGAIDSTLNEVAKFYEEEVNQIMETLPSIIEPLLILILGVGVAAMAVAIIMPMYSLTQSI